jgi:hypothetical protein
MSHPITNPAIHRAASSSQHPHGGRVSVGLDELVDALDDVGRYELGYGETTCAVVRAAAEAIRQLAGPDLAEAEVEL